MVVPSKVLDLVRHFDEKISEHHSEHYNETEVRREFIDPFFESLGWDVENIQGNSKAYKDVIHEDYIKIAGAPKKPDYSFCSGGVRQFFVEAKKPQIHLQSDASASFQLRRYGWSAKLPLSILTNFNELVIYDCRVMPNKDDNASIARTHYFHFIDYSEKWDIIASLLSKDAVLNGSLNKYAESLKTHKGVATVDIAFLKEIEIWREILAHDIAAQNRSLLQRDLNFAVQMTIDRIIFLRICEDRGIEPYGRLQNFQESDQVYESLRELFRQADERYNSGLFHFKMENRSNSEDTLSLSLSISNEPLRKIIKSLYYPDSPYEFSVLSADILGQVYEQFLGKIIRLESNQEVVVDEKPEVKKSGGIYYTPTYIVDYIVKHTIGELVKGKTPQEVSNLRFLDPACGSGSFLIGVYQFLLDWHLHYYLNDSKQKRKKPIYQGLGGIWRLTTDERKRILLNNIYGVDIDTQAVEVTKLSLLLKILEGESEQTLATQLRMFHERALPDLNNNIKCGNSLIGPDFYEIQQMSFLGEEEQYRINTFDWNAEFSSIMHAGGFDTVIGNPPYIFGEQHNQTVKPYFQLKFNLAKGQLDTYKLFIEQGLKLTNEKGRFALIVPDALLARDENQATCEMLLQNGLERIYHCGLVFKAAVSAVVFTVAKGCLSEEIVSEIRDNISAVIEHTCNRQRFFSDPKHRLLVHASDQEAEIISRIESECKSLDNFVEISRGEEIGKKNVLSKGSIPIIVGDDISRYQIKLPSRFVEVTTKPIRFYQSPKIVIVKTGDQCIAALDVKNYTTMQSVYNAHILFPNVAYEAILGILNSRLVCYYIYKTFTAYKLLFPQLNQTTIQSIPVPLDIHEKQAPLVDLVRHMLSLHEKLAMVRTNYDKTFFQRQIEVVDRQIDSLIYKLYGISIEESKIIEQVGNDRQ